MKTSISRFLPFSLLVLALIPAPGQAAWQPVRDTPPAYQDFVALVSPATRPLAAASSRQIFEQSETGWNALPPLPTSETIRDLYYFEHTPDRYFVLTASSLFVLDLEHLRYERLYHHPEPHLLSFLILHGPRDYWLLGHTDGLLESRDGGRSWRRLSAAPFFGAVSAMAENGAFLWMASGPQLYRTTDLQQFDLVFRLTGVTQNESETKESDFLIENESEEEEMQVPAFPILKLLVSQHSPEWLWAATRHGVFESRDSGNHWRPLSGAGFREAVQALTHDPETNVLYTASRRGVFAHPPDGPAQSLSDGGLSAPPRALVWSRDHTLWITSREGLLTYAPLSPEITPVPEPVPDPEILKLFHRLLRAEPRMRETLDAMVRYMNLSNSKTQRWHWQSRLRALVPSFSYGRDFDRSNNIDIDRGSTSEPDQYIFGPEDFSRGWDWDISWDLGDLIWNTAQTSIDSRDKLMVDLRRDMLAEVTHLFHERRRLQAEILFQPSAAPLPHMEKLIRLDELTALLDGLTGGYFAPRVAAVYEREPELAALWNYRG